MDEGRWLHFKIGRQELPITEEQARWLANRLRRRGATTAAEKLEQAISTPPVGIETEPADDREIIAVIDEGLNAGAAGDLPQPWTSLRDLRVALSLDLGSK